MTASDGLFVCVERRLTHRFRGGLPERAKCANFIRHNVKHSIQLCNPQQVVNASARIHELEMAATAANGRMCPHELSQPGAVDEIDALQIQQDAIVSTFQKIANRVAQHACSFGKRDFADDIGDHGAMRLPSGDAIRRGNTSVHT